MLSQEIIAVLKSAHTKMINTYIGKEDMLGNWINFDKWLDILIEKQKKYLELYALNLTK